MVAKKTVWVYDEDGYLVGTDIAVESPLERGTGRFLIPAMATDTAPPDPAAGKDVRWTGTAWEEVNARLRSIAQPGEPERQDARSLRNRLLYASDWTQLPDVPQWVNVSEWRKYRQALRDVPRQAGFPSQITWPQSPQ